jgi:hypothetical protein
VPIWPGRGGKTSVSAERSELAFAAGLEGYH